MVPTAPNALVLPRAIIVLAKSGGVEREAELGALEGWDGASADEPVVVRHASEASVLAMTTGALLCHVPTNADVLHLFALGQGVTSGADDAGVFFQTRARVVAGVAIEGEANTGFSCGREGGCPPGYYVRSGAPAFAYGGGGYGVVVGPSWYNPWIWYSGRWVYRPYRYWYFNNGGAYWRPGWRPGHYEYHYRRW